MLRDVQARIEVLRAGLPEVLRTGRVRVEVLRAGLSEVLRAGRVRVELPGRHVPHARYRRIKVQPRANTAEMGSRA